jgi:hypothetical protein
VYKSPEPLYFIAAFLLYKDAFTLAGFEACTVMGNNFPNCFEAFYFIQRHDFFA